MPQPQQTAPQRQRTATPQQITVESDAGLERVALVPKFRGLSAIEGEVRSQQARKRAYAAAAACTDDTVLNNVRLRIRGADGPPVAREVVRMLKQDPETAGITIGCPDRTPRHKSVFHVDVRVDGSTVTLDGRVPSPELRSYLESRVWLVAGVSRVINGLLPLLGRRVDVARVAEKLLSNLPGSGGAVAVEAGTRVRLFEPPREPEHRRVVERGLWSIPEVTQVRCAQPDA